MFGDYGYKFFKSQKSEEEIIKEENKIKIEMINKLSTKTKNNNFKKNAGFISKYKK
jgi:hypothetical protein